MSLINHTASVAVVPLTSLTLGKLGLWLGDVDGLPSWVTPLLGPAGALVGMIIALRWLVARLDKSEAREELRRKERDGHLQTLVTLTIQNQEVIEQNSLILKDVREAIKKP